MNTGYITDDLMVVYRTPDELDAEPTKNYKKVWSTNNYTVFYCKRGNCTVQNGAHTLNVSDNQLVIIDAHNAFGFQFDSDDFECIYFQIAPSHFSHIKDDSNFLRAFEHIKPTNSIIKCTKENQVFKIYFDSLIECIKLHFGQSHVFPRVFSIISQLAIYFDKNFPNDTVTSDSIPTQIVNFVNRNYLNNITYEVIMDKYFVSKPVINNIMRKYTGFTLREYVEKLRLTDAKAMLTTKDAKRVAQLCGYKTYSTFFRAYKRFYGTIPSEHIVEKSSKQWPLKK